MQDKKHSPIWTFMALAILALFIIFVVYPLALILYKSVIDPKSGAITFENFIRFFTRKYYTNTLLNSFKVTTVVTLICAFLGLVMAYIIKQYNIKGSSTLNIAIVLSYLSPPFIGAYSWISCWVERVCSRRQSTAHSTRSLKGSTVSGVSCWSFLFNPSRWFTCTFREHWRIWITP